MCPDLINVAVYKPTALSGGSQCTLDTDHIDVSHPEGHHAPWAFLSQFSVFFLMYFFHSFFCGGHHRFGFCILSFQASCALILQLTGVNCGPECPQIVPFVPCKPFLYITL